MYKTELEATKSALIKAQRDIAAKNSEATLEEIRVEREKEQAQIREETEVATSRLRVYDKQLKEKEARLEQVQKEKEASQAREKELERKVEALQNEVEESLMMLVEKEQELQQHLDSA